MKFSFAIAQAPPLTSYLEGTQAPPDTAEVFEGCASDIRNGLVVRIDFDFFSAICFRTNCFVWTGFQAIGGVDTGQRLCDVDGGTV